MPARLHRRRWNLNADNLREPHNSRVDETFRLRNEEDCIGSFHEFGIRNPILHDADAMSIRLTQTPNFAFGEQHIGCLNDDEQLLG